MGILPGEAPLEQNWKTTLGKQRQTIRAIYAAEYTREKMKEIKALNIYKLNIYQVLTFMFKIKRDTAPATFGNDCREISHRYPSGLSQSNFVEGNIVSNQTKFPVSSRGSSLWNRLLNQEQKNMAYINDSVTSLLCLENEIIYFWIWGRKIKDNNSLYCILFDSHCMRSDVIPYGFLW